MKTITLTDAQMQKVYDALDSVEDGSFDLEIEIDETLTVFATGWLETDGYVEDDFHRGYMNGTGAYVETYRSASVELSATLYDEDGNEEDVAISAEQEKQADRHLNTAA